MLDHARIRHEEHMQLRRASLGASASVGEAFEGDSGESPLLTGAFLLGGGLLGYYLLGPLFVTFSELGATTAKVTGTLMGAGVGYVLDRSRAHADDTYVDRNGVTWTLVYSGRIDGPHSWAAEDKGRRYGLPDDGWPARLSTTVGSKEQAIGAAMFYAQEHKPVK